MSKKAQKLTKAIVTNKNLDYDYASAKANITKGRYSYYDFDKATVVRIASIERLQDLHAFDCRILVQALFPNYLQCSGLFDQVLLFDVVNGERVDPPKYYYFALQYYLNNDVVAKVNRLIDEIKDLFISNDIVYSAAWQSYFDEWE